MIERDWQAEVLRDLAAAERQDADDPAGSAPAPPTRFRGVARPDTVIPPAVTHPAEPQPPRPAPPTLAPPAPPDPVPPTSAVLTPPAPPPALPTPASAPTVLAPPSPPVEMVPVGTPPTAAPAPPPDPVAPPAWTVPTAPPAWQPSSGAMSPPVRHTTPEPVHPSWDHPVSPPDPDDPPVGEPLPRLPSTPTPPAQPYARRSLHGDPAWRRAVRAVGRIAGPSVAAEIRDHTDVVATIQSPVTTCRRIGVLGIRGGCGKSSVSALVSLAYAAHRRDPVLAVDADAAPGSLDLRLGSTAAGTDRWAPTEQQFRHLTEASAYLARTHHGLQVLREPVDLDAALAAFNRFFAVMVVDRGSTRTHHQERLDTWHSLIYVTPATVDGVMSALTGLETIARSGQADVLARTVVVLSEINPHAGVNSTDALRTLTVGGATPILLPYDRHLAAGAAIHPEMLAESTRLIARRVAATALTRALTA